MRMNAVLAAYLPPMYFLLLSASVRDVARDDGDAALVRLLRGAEVAWARRRAAGCEEEDEDEGADVEEEGEKEEEEEEEGEDD